VTLTAGPAAAAVVHADPDRLRQALGNLITNAIRATAAGGRVDVTVRAHGDTVAIVVHDTGVGIAAEDLPHVFDRFWRADSARGRGTGGSGLGLAITRQIMTDHGGGIAVASTSGVGSAFTLTLPVARSADARATRGALTRPGDSPEG
jgi:two-component system sensor histidine kinase BaeS